MRRTQLRMNDMPAPVARDYERLRFTSLKIACLAQRATGQGHSSHYSSPSDAGQVQTNYRVHYSHSGKEEDEGFSINNVLASYFHLHFRAIPRMERRPVQGIRRIETREMVLETNSLSSRRLVGKSASTSRNANRGG